MDDASGQVPFDDGDATSASDGGRPDAGRSNSDRSNGDRPNGEQWYVNTRTGKPELGMISPMNQRMGPYATYEDAMHAKDIVEERNALWDAQTKAWDDWGEDGGADIEKHADEDAH